MYERFTDRARKVMQLANQEAQRFNHEYISPDHVLLGIVKEGSGTASLVLQTMGVKLRKVRLEVEKLIEAGPEMISMGKLPQTPACKDLIQFSMEEARNLDHNHVGTEHLLLALTRVKQTSIEVVLNKLEVDSTKVRELVLELVESSDEVDEELPMNARANRVINHARQAAIKMGAWVFDTEHLLIGIANEYGCDAAFCLRSAGVDVSTLTATAMRMFPSNETHPPTRISMGPVAEQAIKLAEKVARGLEHKFVNAEHLMLGLLENVDEESAKKNADDQDAIVFNSTKVLESLNINIPSFKEELMLYLKHGSQQLSEASNPVSSESPRPLNKKTPNLNRFGTDLTRWAQYQFSSAVDLDPVVLETICLTLMRRNRNNVLLVGDRREAMIYLKSLAKMLVRYDAPYPLYNYALVRVINFSLDPKTTLANQLVSMFNEARIEGETILAFEDIAELIDFKSPYNRKLSLLNMILPWLRLPRPQIIGFIEPDRFEDLKSSAKILDCFDVIELSNFQPPRFQEIVQQNVSRMEDFHLCTFAAGTVEVAIELCEKYLPDSYVPVEAKMVLDQSAAEYSIRIRHSQEGKPATLQTLDDRLTRLEKRMQTCREEGDYEELLKLDGEFDKRLASRIEIQPLPEISIQMVEKTMAKMLAVDVETIIERHSIDGDDSEKV